MKIVIEVSEKDYESFLFQYIHGILDEKTPSHRAKIAIAKGIPLIHCKDCKHFFNVGKEDTGLCDNHGGFFTSVDGFCSIADRRVDKEGVEENDSKGTD